MSNILLKKVLIANELSEFNGLIKDIYIENSCIVEIADEINHTNCTVFNQENSIVSSGWVDVFSHFCDPGFEYRETLSSGAKAAVAGGFTQVFVLPNTNPVIQSKSQVEYIVQQSKTLPIQVYPLGAITKNIEGKDLAEMYDMQNSGAIAFSDGLQPIQTPGLLLKALQYVKAFDGTVIQMPIDKSIGANGLMNEGIVSTQLGLPGIPTIAEEIMIQRDIDLVRYTKSKLHITGISTAKSVALLQAAKAEGLAISCSVTPYHLFYCDEDLQSYNTNLKVNPPLRTREDMLALRAAVANGSVDCIATHHTPHNFDAKICEFEYAKNGMIGLQTAFATIQHILPNLHAIKLAQLFSNNARNLFGLPNAAINIQQPADLTIFTQHNSTTITKENNQSKSFNTPFENTTLNGKVLGIVTKGELHLN
ncbi:MAG: dihydroorotase [Chitinophagaceae bacterium]|jgi:dihydroorotase|nr:dihydroorotase [Chitinophagaceae bacterium]MBP9740854.1 dihydroorotase [Chitinophagaceae bacterium]